MSEIPEAAIDAAAQAFEDTWDAAIEALEADENPDVDEFMQAPTRAALEAAMPAIRQQIAEEVRAARFLTGPELRENICAFIAEGSGE